MNRDEIDGWLSEDDAIVPSSGFADGVMEAVRREASDTRALPFPWMRALPGFIALVLPLMLALVFGSQAATEVNPASIAVSNRLMEVATNPATAWLVLALLLCFAVHRNGIAEQRLRASVILSGKVDACEIGHGDANRVVLRSVHGTIDVGHPSERGLGFVEVTTGERDGAEIVDR